MEPEITAAIIGAIALIVVAVIERWLRPPPPPPPPVTRYESFTITRNKQFQFELGGDGITVFRGANFGIMDFLDSERTMILLKRLHETFGDESFLLDNSVTPLDDRVEGLGTMFEEVFNCERGYVQVTSQLASVLCVAEIFEHVEDDFPTRFRLICLPNSWEELLRKLKSTSVGRGITE